MLDMIATIRMCKRQKYNRKLIGWRQLIYRMFLNGENGDIRNKAAAMLTKCDNGYTKNKEVAMLINCDNGYTRNNEAVMFRNVVKWVTR